MFVFVCAGPGLCTFYSGFVLFECFGDGLSEFVSIKQAFWDLFMLISKMRIKIVLKRFSHF